MRTKQMIAPFLVGMMLTAASYAGTSDVADAAMKRDQAAVRMLLGKKADVNAPQADGATALHWAVYHEDVALVDELLGAGANVMAANREGEDRQFGVVNVQPDYAAGGSGLEASRATR